MAQFIQALINGIALGGMYAILVLGFSIIWGVMGVINFAHGEFVMLGAYMAWIGNTQFGLDPFVSTPIVFLLSAAFGYILQRVLVNRVIDRPHLVSLLVMFGVSIMMSSGLKLIFSADVRRSTSDLQGSVEIFDGVTLPVTKSIVFIFALAVLGALSLFLQSTRLGKSIRAAAQNREAAQIVGIEIDKVYAITFALCIGITGVAGALISPISPIQPFNGPPLTLKAFAVTAMAGLGSVKGALGGAIVLGLIEAVLAVYIAGVGASLAIVASFALLVIALVLRPQGLFGGLRPVDATAT